MVSHEFFWVILLGALLALPFCLFARRRRNPASTYAAGLVIAALIYVVFALTRGGGPALYLELGGVALFTLVALAGMRWSLLCLSGGWLFHVAWDLALHPVDFSGYAPWWYPVLCIGFDLFVAGFILAAAYDARNSAGHGARRPSPQDSAKPLL